MRGKKKKRDTERNERETEIGIETEKWTEIDR